MKKKLLAIICIATGYITTAQTISIPDPVFEQVLIDKEVDSDGIVNGQILTADALAVTTLTITSPDIASNISINDLTGIEGFTNLESLTVTVTMIEELNVSTLTKLKSLSCPDNMLTSLNVSNNPLLESLNITSTGDVMPINDITQIDLSNNPNIKTLVAVGGINYINLKNGHNNPDMTINISSGSWGIPPEVIQGHICIEVDNPTAAQNGQLPYSYWTIYDMNKTYAFVENCALSNSKFTKSTILVYPNPVSDVLHIETTNGTSIDKVILYDISGRAVKEYQNIPTEEIPVSNLEKGVYIMQTFSGKQSQTEKIIIK
ncbi:hypothetical protein D3C87_352570 [compost metagenome]